MTKYTNEQIREAIREGHGRPRDGIIPEWEVDMYQDFLDALPEPYEDYNIDTINQLHRLQGMTGSINETLNWLIALNQVVAYGIDPDVLLALTQPVQQQDDWQRTDWDIPKVNDRIRVEFGAGGIYEGHVSARMDKTLVSENMSFSTEEYVQHHDGNKLYYIPAPVTHPDPSEHPVIADVQTKGNGPYEYAIWDGTGRYLCYTQGRCDIELSPKGITRFTPAKVVEDDR